MKLFVSYFGVKKTGGTMIGNIVCEVKGREKIDEETVREVEKEITKENGYKKTIALNLNIIEA